MYEALDVGTEDSWEQMTALQWEGMGSCCYGHSRKKLNMAEGHRKYLASMPPQSSCCGPKFLHDKQPQPAEMVTPTCLGQQNCFLGG